MSLLHGAERRLVEVEEREERQEAALVEAQQTELERRVLRAVHEGDLRTIAHRLGGIVANGELAAALELLDLVHAKRDLRTADGTEPGANADAAALEVLLEVRGGGARPPAEHALVVDRAVGSRALRDAVPRKTAEREPHDGRDKHLLHLVLLLFCESGRNQPYDEYSTSA